MFCTLECVDCNDEKCEHKMSDKEKMEYYKKRSQEIYKGFIATTDEVKELTQKNEQLEERINKAIELLKNSQIYNARSYGKTLFMELIDEEIKILEGE